MLKPLGLVIWLLFWDMGPNWNTPFEIFQTFKVTNPWKVSSIYDFYYFCCPECDSKSQNKQDFVNHASTIHPWVSLKFYLTYDSKMNLRL